jgi:adenosyl cobinamide kinase/adenosyl cobinamide phosphate guanylyltransferase
MQYCEETEPDPSDMTDEELERSLMEQTIQLIRARPEFAVMAADEIGWTVIPPSDGEPNSVEFNADNPQSSHRCVR